MCDWYLQRIRNPNHSRKAPPLGAQYITDLIIVTDTSLKRM
jgi:hypothetical protein